MFIRKRAGKTVKKSKTASTEKTTPVRGKTTKVKDDEFISMVQKKAYEFYIERGGEHGSDRADWYRAEQEVEKGIQGGIEVA